jgi:hypothetical protein
LFPYSERTDVRKKKSIRGVSTIKGKYFNGTGGGGYWSFEKLDSLGRIIEKENYRKKSLLSKEEFIYNSNDDKLYYIVTYDIDNPYRIDTISRYEYKYQDNRIVYQKMIGSRGDSTVIRLIDSKEDIVVFQSLSYYFRPKTNTIDIYEKRYTLKYQDELLIQFEEFDLSRNDYEIIYFEYYPNGMLKRRKTKRKPESEIQSYLGGPGNDDMFYEYELDKEGRVRNLYYLINGKKYKMAVYKYNK